MNIVKLHPENFHTEYDKYDGCYLITPLSKDGEYLSEAVIRLYCKQSALTDAMAKRIFDAMNLMSEVRCESNNSLREIS